MNQLESITATAQPKIEQTLQTVLTWLQHAGDFTSEQAPLAVQEALKWGIAEAVLSALCALTFFGSACVAGVFAVKCVKNGVTLNSDEWLGGGMLLTIYAVVTGIVSSIVAATNIMTAAKIYTAPRLYLIERFTDLVSK